MDWRRPRGRLGELGDVHTWTRAGPGAGENGLEGEWVRFDETYDAQDPFWGAWGREPL